MKAMTVFSGICLVANTVYDKDVEGTVHAEIDHGDIVTALNDRCREFDNVFTSAPAIHAERAMGPVFNENARSGPSVIYTIRHYDSPTHPPHNSLQQLFKAISSSVSIKISNAGPVTVVKAS